MSVFDKFTNKVTDTAKAAAKKSGEIVEASKLNAAINQENEKVSKLYEAIGKLVYETYSNGERLSEDINKKCDEIVDIKANIHGLKDRIIELKNIKICKNCNHEIEEDVIFCPNCGMKQAVIASPKDETKDI